LITVFFVGISSLFDDLLVDNEGEVRHHFKIKTKFTRLAIDCLQVQYRQALARLQRLFKTIIDQWMQVVARYLIVVFILTHDYLQIISANFGLSRVEHTIHFFVTEC
jgi:hypothetical protein